MCTQSLRLFQYLQTLSKYYTMSSYDTSYITSIKSASKFTMSCLINNTIIILQRLRRTFYQANFLFSNGPNSTSFSFIFVFFKQTLQSLQQIYVKKCDDHPVYSAGIRTHNLQPSSSHSYTFEAQPKLSSCCSCQTA